jgi:hypothetical protein
VRLSVILISNIGDFNSDIVCFEIFYVTFLGSFPRITAGRVTLPELVRSSAAW